MVHYNLSVELPLLIRAGCKATAKLWPLLFYKNSTISSLPEHVKLKEIAGFASFLVLFQKNLFFACFVWVRSYG